MQKQSPMETLKQMLQKASMIVPDYAIYEVDIELSEFEYSDSLEEMGLTPCFDKYRIYNRWNIRLQIIKSSRRVISIYSEWEDKEMNLERVFLYEEQI